MTAMLWLKGTVPGRPSLSCAAVTVMVFGVLQSWEGLGRVHTHEGITGPFTDGTDLCAIRTHCAAFKKLAAETLLEKVAPPGADSSDGGDKDEWALRMAQRAAAHRKRQTSRPCRCCEESAS